MSSARRTWWAALAIVASIAGCGSTAGPNGGVEAGGDATAAVDGGIDAPASADVGREAPLFADVEIVPPGDGADVSPVAPDVRRGPPVPGSVCLLNSDCENPLACAAGRCHEQCLESRDCTYGSRCVKLMQVGVCLLPQEAALCSLNSDCPGPLICAPDRRCRNQCNADIDCGKNQKCVVERVCADISEFNPTTNRLNPPPPGDAGVSGDGGPG